MRPEPELTLAVAGRAYGGWKAVSVRRSMGSCAGSFELGFSEVWAGREEPAPVFPGERCELRLGADPIITGWVDVWQAELDAARHEVAVQGRDAAGDLVDCSAVGRSGQWRGRRIEEIAADLARPFGVAVRADVDTGKPLASFALQEGETVYEAIERAARIRALLLVSDGLGGLVITRAGRRRAPTPLVLGGNALQVRGRIDVRDRFSQYTIKGQAPGSDFFNGRAAAQMVARAVDAGVKRYRPLVVVGECPDLSATLTQRAEWEMQVRAARSTEVEVKVRGWTHRDGPWEPNTLVQVTAAPLRLDHELLIVDVEYGLDQRGSVTRLAMTSADAYTLLPAKAETAEAGPGAFWALPKQATR